MFSWIDSRVGRKNANIQVIVKYQLCATTPLIYLNSAGHFDVALEKDVSKNLNEIRPFQRDIYTSLSTWLTSERLFKALCFGWVVVQHKSTDSRTSDNAAIPGMKLHCSVFYSPPPPGAHKQPNTNTQRRTFMNLLCAVPLSCNTRTASIDFEKK